MFQFQRKIIEADFERPFLEYRFCSLFSNIESNCIFISLYKFLKIFVEQKTSTRNKDYICDLIYCYVKKYWKKYYSEISNATAAAGSNENFANDISSIFIFHEKYSLDLFLRSMYTRSITVYFHLWFNLLIKNMKLWIKHDSLGCTTSEGCTRVNEEIIFVKLNEEKSKLRLSFLIDQFLSISSRH